MNVQIVRPCSWGELNAKTWALIIHNIAKGESFGIWCGSHRDIPWRTGKCALRVKVGKKRKLVRGTLEERYEGFGESGETYSLFFTPAKARILTRKLLSASYDHIVDR